MRWTHAKPTEAGFYWLKMGSSRPQIIHVFEAVPEFTLQFEEHGFRGTHPVSYLNSSYRFFGPIKEPE